MSYSATACCSPKKNWMNANSWNESQVSPSLANHLMKAKTSSVEPSLIQVIFSLLDWQAQKTSVQEPKKTDKVSYSAVRNKL